MEFLGVPIRFFSREARKTPRPIVAEGGRSVSRAQGVRVGCPKRPDWGVGHVLTDDGGAKVTVFFLGGVKRTLDTSTEF